MTSPPLTRVSEAIETTMDELRQSEAGCRLVLAVSGGRDSMAMLHASAILAQPRDALHVVHVHHGIRGDEADTDADYVAHCCEELGLGCSVVRTDARGAAKRLHIGIQQAARTVRYAALRRCADDLGGATIATAHTADDNVETILLRIVRGTGLHGLAGIPALSNGLVRPLLAVTRRETQAYCRAVGIEYRDDSSNESTKYSRNRLRLSVLPELRSHVNQGVDRALLRLAATAAQADEYLAECAAQKVHELVSTSGTTLDRARLASLHPALQAACLRHWLTATRGGTDDLDAGLYEWCTAPCARSSTARTLPGGHVISRTDATLTIADPGFPSSVRRVEHSVPVVEAAEALGLNCRLWYSDSPVEGSQNLPVPASRVSTPLSVRNRRPGDRIRIKGVGTVKLQDLFVNHKVPRLERDWVPVICDDLGPLWVVGHAVDERALVPCDERPAVYVVCQWYTAPPISDH